jgi:hypothetical protein
MKFGQIVYHVANPKVQGVVIEALWMEHQRWVKVYFERAVKFTGNAGRYSREWDCSKNLLFPSSQQAQDAHDPNHGKKSVTQTVIDAFDGLGQDVSAEGGAVHAKIQPIHVFGILGHPEISEEQANCDHEWVTWTGLKGTVTDCTKCKRVQK